MTAIPFCSSTSSQIQLSPFGMVKVTYYLEVISSWCYWAEPVWAELKKEYAGKADFGWKIAQMPAEAYPQSKSQCEWFYRRSGTIMRSPFMLNSGWFEPGIKQYLVPNYVAEAARELAVTDDRVRLALAHAALREGQKVGSWDVAIAVAAKAGALDKAALLARAESPEVATRIEETTAEFNALKVNQRPTFLIENRIGDRAVLSGVARIESLAAIIDALATDEAAYVSWQAHCGDPPES